MNIVNILRLCLKIWHILMSLERLVWANIVLYVLVKNHDIKIRHASIFNYSSCKPIESTGFWLCNHSVLTYQSSQALWLTVKSVQLILIKVKNVLGLQVGVHTASGMVLDDWDWEAYVFSSRGGYTAVGLQAEVQLSGKREPNLEV